ncbi:acyltransferase family protein [Sphingobacterium sp. Mn56C]|uniref:acyltransferase family protein n=1 Tax=Sphingobacterium sp. Mn56C TaxID=3395261 RepID=UPI003BB9E960
MHFRNDIQGLRALAFLFVFVFHLYPNLLPGGFIGVDMFFVISGYLISSIILNQKEKSTFTFTRFFESRFKCIVPAYYVFLLFVSVGIYFHYLPSDLLNLKQALKYAAIFASNFYFAAGDSYFGARLNENPLLHTWSLGIEMQFYFLLPFVLIWIKNKYLPYIVGGLIVFITAFTQYKLDVDGFSSGLYFSLYTRIPEFLIGVFLALTLKNGRLNHINGFVTSAAGFSILLLSLFYINEHTPFPGVLALLPCLGIALILIAKENPMAKFLSSKPLVYIGNLSYSLYLWHWLFMAIIRYKNGLYSGYTFTLQESLLITVLTIITAWLSYNLVENTFRKLSNRRFLIAISPVVAMFAISTFYLSIYAENNKIPADYNGASFALQSHYENKTEVIGDSFADGKNIFLFGDSHALVIKPFFDELGKSENFKVRTLTCDTYPALAGLSDKHILATEKRFYDYSRSLVDATNKEIQHSDVIIFSTVDINRMPEMPAALNNLASNLRQDQSLILVKTFKTITKNPVRVNQGYVKNSSEKFLAQDRRKNAITLDSIAALHKNVYSIDLSDSNVYQDFPYYRDTLLYYDANHINQRGARLLAKDLEKKYADLIHTVLKK